MTSQNAEFRIEYSKFYEDHQGTIANIAATLEILHQSNISAEDMESWLEMVKTPWLRDVGLLGSPLPEIEQAIALTDYRTALTIALRCWIKVAIDPEYGLMTLQMMLAFSEFVVDEFSNDDTETSFYLRKLSELTEEFAKFCDQESL